MPVDQSGRTHSSTVNVLLLYQGPYCFAFVVFLTSPRNSLKLLLQESQLSFVRLILKNALGSDSILHCFFCGWGEMLGIEPRALLMLDSALPLSHPSDSIVSEW